MSILFWLYYFLRNKCLAKLGVCSPDDTVLFRPSLIWRLFSQTSGISEWLWVCNPGGVVDARGLQGAHTFSANPFAGVTKAVTLLLDQVTITTSVTISIPSYCTIIGAGIGSTTANGTRIVASANTVTPIVQFLGTDASSNRVVKSAIHNLTITGIYLASQIGLYLDHATDIKVYDVQFTECGQAIDANDVYGLHLYKPTLIHCGSGNTASTTTIRFENRSNTGTRSEQLYIEHALFEGDSGGKQGMAVYFGPFTAETAIRNSKMDYGSTNSTSRVLAFHNSWYGEVSGCTIAATTISGANAVIEVTGPDASNKSFCININNNPVISTSAAIPAIKFDYAKWSNVLGNIFTSPGSNASLITLGANSTDCVSAGNNHSQSTDTICTDAGTNNTIANHQNGSGDLKVGSLAAALAISAAISSTVGTSGSTGRVTLVNGGASNTGYAEFRLANGTRLGYIGNESANLGVTLENSALFTVQGGLFSVDSSGNIRSLASMILVGGHGETWTRGQITESITLSTSGSTTDSVANLLPANSIIEAVVARVTTAITTATDWKLGDGTTAARFTSANATMTAGATDIGLNHQKGGVSTDATGPVQAAAAKLRITTTGTPGAGVIRVTVFYRQFVAPTS
jgi:hypothetical protein